MNDSLIETLPSALNDAARRVLGTAETILISLSGALGEALVATDRNIVVVRETDPYHEPDAYAHPIARVKDVITGSSPSGGYLSISAVYPVSDDGGTVYFPAEKQALFEAAAAVLRTRLAMAPSNTNSTPMPQPVASAPQNTPVCPKCGASVGERHAFCAKCGEQLQDICEICGSAMSRGALYCPQCGSDAKPAGLSCDACGARANSRFMTYCPQCGTALKAKCAACGASIVAGLPHCRFCGREIGSASGISGRSISRLAMHKDSEAPAVVETPPAVEEEPPASQASVHNARGAEFFDEEKIKEAADEFRMAVTLEPNNASYHCNLAVAYGELDMDDDARREYERALELDPNERTSLLYLGCMLNESDEVEQARTLWQRLIQTSPGTPEAEEAAQNMQAQNQL
jgi:tetratricopeptide (TPR) repeat protein